jgi:hypothetical protein
LFVAIHQPNYLPWLGYFHKMAAADVFIFLDDVPFSKGSYTNRVKIMARGEGHWLTVPISVHLGDPINQVRVATSDWTSSHRIKLRSTYSKASAFDATWPRIEEILDGIPESDLATINRHLIEIIAGDLGLNCQFLASSEIDVKGATGDDRLVALVTAVSPDGTYLSGRGGEKYQSEYKFTDAGFGFRYANFVHPTYAQSDAPFVPGLSIIDAIFHLGWTATSDLIRGVVKAPR